MGTFSPKPVSPPMVALLNHCPSKFMPIVFLLGVPSDENKVREVPYAQRLCLEEVATQYSVVRYYDIDILGGKYSFIIARDDDGNLFDLWGNFESIDGRSFVDAIHADNVLSGWKSAGERMRIGMLLSKLADWFTLRRLREIFAEQRRFEEVSRAIDLARASLNNPKPVTY